MTNKYFLPLPGPEILREWDARSLSDFGIPAVLLMENAARSALALLREKISLRDKTILIFMGKGNNGGDAAALARMLHESRACVLVCHAFCLDDALDGDIADIQNPAYAHIRWAHAAGTPFHRIDPRDMTLPEAFQNPHVVVDGLLGTGFTPPVREDMRRLFAGINAMRQSRRPAHILALDLPSGMDAMTGRPSPSAVQADWTITFEAKKPGMLSCEGQALCGEIRCAPVGIPEKIKCRTHIQDYEIGKECIALTPAPTPEMHKGSSGHVLVVGGSENFPGAPVLSALGAFRAGAGLVTLAAPECILPGIRAALPDAMSIPLERFIERNPAQSGQPDFSRWNALVVGPGLGAGENALRVMRAILRAKRGAPEFPPAVFDADALNILSIHPELLEFLTKDDVLTPHPGEMARLLGVETPKVQDARRSALKRLCQKCRAAIVLKGAYTLLSANQEPVLHSPFALPALAVGGSGDILSGVIGAFLARRSAGNALNSLCSRSLALAAAAVYAHGAAGRRIQDIYPERGNLPSEIANAVSAACAQLRAELSGLEYKGACR